MPLLELITADLKEAMIAQKTEDVSTLRLLLSEVKNQRIATGADLDDAGIVQLVRKEVKKRRESAEAYTKANRVDLAEKELSEATLLGKYLPTAVDSAILEDFVKGEVAKYSPFEPRHRGEVIRAAMQQFAGQVDGKAISDAVARIVG